MINCDVIFSAATENSSCDAISSAATFDSPANCPVASLLFSHFTILLAEKCVCKQWVFRIFVPHFCSSLIGMQYSDTNITFTSSPRQFLYICTSLWKFANGLRRKANAASEGRNSSRFYVNSISAVAKPCRNGVVIKKRFPTLQPSCLPFQLQISPARQAISRTQLSGVWNASPPQPGYDISRHVSKFSQWGRISFVSIFRVYTLADAETSMDDGSERKGGREGQREEKGRRFHRWVLDLRSSNYFKAENLLCTWFGVSPYTKTTSNP